MKISVCGKGGSGKSTLVTLLANQAVARGLSVLVVDADESNTGLFRLLDFDQPPVPLMELAGGKKKIKDKIGRSDTLKAEQIGIADKIQKLAAGMQKPTAAVLSKVPSTSIARRLKDELRVRGIDVIGTFPSDPLVFEAGLAGHGLKRGPALNDAGKILDDLL
jgi:CO dehydrogenase nickel-insertion accessory protein CooC1